MDSVSVTFNPPPTLILSSTQFYLCTGSILFTDSSITGNVSDPITSWLWTFGDGTTSTLEDPSHIFNFPGTFPVTLTVTTSGGCTSNNSLLLLSLMHILILLLRFHKLNYLDLPYICCSLTTSHPVRPVIMELWRWRNINPF